MTPPGQPSAKISTADELVCLGHEEDLAEQGGALAPPIVQTSLFASPTLADLHAGLREEHLHHVYTRGQNPTVEAVETKIARLEGGQVSKLFASGMAAVSAVLLGLLRAGDHVLFVSQTYGPTLQLARHLGKFGVEHDVLYEVAVDRVEAALRENTRLVWLESPSTMLFQMTDVPAVVAMAEEREILTAMDNSWSTPLFQKPLTRGVDLVVHSATKYLGGHSDVVAGAVVGSGKLLERIFYDAYLLNGGILGPFDAWLLNRGIRTLPARMRQHHASGLRVAEFLEGHPKVDRVFHPGLDEGARGLVRDQLSGYSGLFSFALGTNRFGRVRSFVDRLKLFRIGVSWGGVESLAIAPARGDNDDDLAAQGIPPGTVRLSVGLESPELLIEDLDAALAGV